MQERFIPALYSVLQMRNGQLHPIAREALVRSYSWYLMGTFLPDIPNEQEEQASFLRRWVLSYRDQERAWQKNLADENPSLADLALELMRSESRADQLGEMAAFALGAGVLARHVWRTSVSEDTESHLEGLLVSLKANQSINEIEGDEDSKLDWEAFWRPIWVMQDLLRFPRVIDHVTQSCQRVFSASMSGEALARWSKLSHLRLADALRNGRQENSKDGSGTSASFEKEIETATTRFTSILNHLALAYWDDEMTLEDRHTAGKAIVGEDTLQPAVFNDWKATIHGQRLHMAERGRNPKPAYYAAPPPYPEDSLPPDQNNLKNDRQSEPIENSSDSVDTVEGLPLVVEVNTDPPLSQDTDLESQDAAAPTEDATTIDQEDDTSENEDSSIPGSGTDSSEAAEEKSP